ncbi:MAG: TonB-dependent receptor [Pseudomonadota bacterium]
MASTFKGKTAILAGTCAALSALTAAAQTLEEIDIPAQPLEAALAELSVETGLQVSSPQELVVGKESQGVSGTMAPEAALRAMLAGTGLTFRSLGADGVVISAATPGEGGTLVADPIIVTARRTEEVLEDVPASVFVLGGEEVDRAGISDTDDFSLFAPNVDFTGNDNPARNFFAIRGISDLNVASTGPTIGFFQDGVLQNNTGQVINVNRRIVDVDRVEVIYGPQGTAFGRGTIAGAVNVVTNRPTNEFEAKMTAEIGSFIDGNVETVLNVPISDSVAVRGVFYGQASDGFVDSPFSARNNSVESDNLGGRFSVRVTPIDRLTIDASVQFDRTETDAPIFVLGSTLEDDDLILPNDTVEPLEIERLNLVAEIQYDFDAASIRSITSFNDTTFTGAEDFDFSSATLTALSRNNSEKAFSQEVRVESADFTLPGGFGTFSANGGVIFSDSEGILDQVFSQLTPGGGNSLTFAKTDVQHLSAYGSFRWRPVEPLEIAAGVRVSRDKVSFERDRVFFSGFQSISNSDRSFTSVTPNVSVLYDWTDNISTYASYSTGFRPGGAVGTTAGPAIEFDEERAQNFEVGVKSTWFDGILAVNASAFWLLYDDIQVPISGAFGGGVENAAEAESIGGELSVGLRPIEGLTLQGGVGLNFTEFTDFAQSITGDQTGESLPRASKVSASFIGDYEHPQPLFRDFSPFARAEYSYRSSFSDAVGEARTLDGFGITNFRAGLRGENVEVTLFVENAFDKRYATEAFTIPPQAFVVPGPTRRFGIVGTFRF